MKLHHSFIHVTDTPTSTQEVICGKIKHLKQQIIKTSSPRTHDSISPVHIWAKRIILDENITLIQLLLAVYPANLEPKSSRENWLLTTPTSVTTELHHVGAGTAGCLHVFVEFWHQSSRCGPSPGRYAVSKRSGSADGGSAGWKTVPALSSRTWSKTGHQI